MKKEVSSREITPKILRIILLLSLVLLLAAHIGITYFGLERLKEDSAAVTEAVTASKTTAKELNELKDAERILKTKTASIKASDDLLAKIKDRAYQNNIIHDAIAYGNKSGVAIKGFNFVDDLSAAAASSSSTPNTATKSSVPNVTSRPVVINTSSPVRYDSFLHLLKYLEGNLTQIHLQNLNISAAQSKEGGADKNSVEASTLNVEVYTK